MSKLKTESEIVLSSVLGAAAMLHEFEARRSGILQETKQRGELVTCADRALNIHLVNALHGGFPGDAICAEEGSEWDNPTAVRRWFIDPIDGTRSFVAGESGYSVMVGLVVDGAPHLGVIYDPETRSTIIAEAGEGVWELRDGERKELAPRLSYNLAWSPYSRLEAAGPLAVELRLRGIRMYESVGKRAVALARGEACAFASGPNSPKLWDSAAAAVVVNELGGRYTDFDLRELDYASSDHTHRRGAVASVGMDHVDVVAAVRRILDQRHP